MPRRQKPRLFQAFWLNKSTVYNPCVVGVSVVAVVVDDQNKTTHPRLFAPIFHSDRPVKADLSGQRPTEIWYEAKIVSRIGPSLSSPRHEKNYFVHNKSLMGWDHLGLRLDKDLTASGAQCQTKTNAMEKGRTVVRRIYHRTVELRPARPNPATPSQRCDRRLV